jgi:tellurite resistance protein
MAYYAKISNEEFTVSERARLMEAQSEKSVIEANNKASEEYATLKTAYNNSFTSATLQTLEGELAALQSQYTPEMTEEEKEALNTSITAKQAEIDTEKEALVPEQETALTNLNAKEAEGTETLTSEIETLNTTIANALCRVTGMYTGADEIEMVNGDSSTLDAEIKVLEESKKNYPYNPDTDETKPSELTDIENQIQSKIEEIDAIPKVEKDNTVYWEAYYGGCKRTSYNTKGGVHTLGGTPFRKNYAGVGHIYDPVRDAFYVEQPYASWTLDESTCYWQPPTPKPEEGNWYWKEDTTEWVDYVYINPDNSQPYPSWTWDTTNGGWNPPVEYPENYHRTEWIWDEENLKWIKRG